MTDQTIEKISISRQDLKDLAELRKEEALLNKKVSELQEAMNKTPEADALREAFDARKKIIENISILETFIKRSTLEDFVNTKMKPALFGVTVKIFKVIKYDRGIAEAWAKETNPEAFFKFDEKGFEKYAKAVADTVPVPCVTFEEDPRVEIASDLSEYL